MCKKKNTQQNYKNDKMIEEKISALRARAQNSLGKHHIGNTSIGDIRKYLDRANSSVEKDLIRKKYLAKKLYENQHLIEQMERHANMGFWELNLYTNETVWSDGLYRLLGIGPHQFTPNPQSIIDLAYPAYAESITSKFVELLEHGTAFTLEIKIKAFNSHVQYVSIHNELIEDEDGYPIRISGSVMDITKRILAQKEDHATKSLYKDLIDNLPIGLAQINENGNVGLINKTMREYLRHENEDIEGKTISELSSEHVFNGRFVKMLNALERGVPMKFEDTFHERIYSNIVVPPETEAHASGLLLSTDVTLERRQKKALERSEAKFRSFVEEANDIIYSIDTQGKFSYVSPNIIELLGYSAEELIGNSSIEIVHPEDRQMVLRMIQKISDT
ncbi:MAG: PAS domain S-box protein, partial [Salinivirgaceae bacterium]